jgi:hypothetical protein
VTSRWFTHAFGVVFGLYEAHLAEQTGQVGWQWFWLVFALVSGLSAQAGQPKDNDKKQEKK